MNVIEVQNLRKEFKSFSSRSGLSGAFRDLFTRNYKVHAAVDNISLTIKARRNGRLHWGEWCWKIYDD